MFAAAPGSAVAALRFASTAAATTMGSAAAATRAHRSLLHTQTAAAAAAAVAAAAEGGSSGSGMVMPTMPPFAIIDSTLREGEQFATCEFSTQDRIFIAKTLDKMGVDYIEMVNPMASAQAVKDLERIARLGLSAKLLTHTRCHMSDVKRAVETGVDGVNIYMATSGILRQHSHGKGIDAVAEMAAEVIKYVQGYGLEVRFSCEDTFRSDPTDLLKIYAAVDALGVQRVGVADTVGIATPQQVHSVISQVRAAIKPTTGIEFHTHNDSGCCIANALVALEAGATHIDTSVLGIGERNGITPLGGFLARMYTLDREHVKSKYNLELLAFLERYVAQASEVHIPFNNYVTGSSAFTHKAGVHSKAVMANPAAYEVINPGDFGIERRIQLAHRLTGWNAMQQRAKQLGLDISDDQIKAATTMIKDLADERTISVDEVDAILARLAQGPRVSSSTFMVMDTSTSSEEMRTAASMAAKAVSEYERAAAVAAVKAVSEARVDTRPTSALSVQGHLFDKALLNRLLDIVVDSPCDFQVVQLNVGEKNEYTSSAVLQLWAEKAADLSHTKEMIDSLVKANAPFAECTMSELDLDSLKELKASVLPTA